MVRDKLLAELKEIITRRVAENGETSEAGARERKLVDMIAHIQRQPYTGILRSVRCCVAIGCV